MLEPRLILMDEPSMGLDPKARRLVFETITALNRESGHTILLVEQNARAGLAIAHRGAVMDAGAVAIAAHRRRAPGRPAHGPAVPGRPRRPGLGRRLNGCRLTGSRRRPYILKYVDQHSWELRWRPTPSVRCMPAFRNTRPPASTTRPRRSRRWASRTCPPRPTSAASTSRRSRSIRPSGGCGSAAPSRRRPSSRWQTSSGCRGARSSSCWNAPGTAGPSSSPRLPACSGAPGRCRRRAGRERRCETCCGPPASTAARTRWC